MWLVERGTTNGATHPEDEPVTGYTENPAYHTRYFQWYIPVNRLVGYEGLLGQEEQGKWNPIYMLTWHMPLSNLDYRNEGEGLFSDADIRINYSNVVYFKDVW